MPHAREAYFRGRVLQSEWQNPSWSNLQHGVVFFPSEKASTDPEIAPRRGLGINMDGRDLGNELPVQAARRFSKNTVIPLKVRFSGLGRFG